LHAQGLRLRFLGAHLDRLMRLADDATLRLELAAFPLAPGAEGGIAAEHRAGAAPPEMRPGPGGDRQ